MKNLIYLVSDENYKECLKICVDSIFKHNDIDVCCIAPENFKPYAPTKTYFVKNFDWKYRDKYSIVNWNDFDNYDNFLYLDSDTICYKKLDSIFNNIQESPENMHCVSEILEPLSLGGIDGFRFSESLLSDPRRYNAGTFGFNKKIKPIIFEFLSYIEKYKGITWSDQPLFNEFFISKNMTINTLSKYVYLEGEIWKTANSISQNDACVRHYLGRYGNSGIKHHKMEEAFLFR